MTDEHGEDYYANWVAESKKQIEQQVESLGYPVSYVKHMYVEHWYFRYGHLYDLIRTNVMNNTEKIKVLVKVNLSKDSFIPYVFKACFLLITDKRIVLSTKLPLGEIKKIEFNLNEVKGFKKITTRYEQFFDFVLTFREGDIIFKLSSYGFTNEAYIKFADKVELDIRKAISLKS